MNATLCAMAGLMTLLRSRGYELDETRLVRALDMLLPRRTEPSASLSEQESDYLERFSGLVAAGEEQKAELDARRIAALTAEVAQSLSRPDVASLLGISPSRVSHRQAEGALYAFSVGPGRSLYPDWQFAGRTVLPHLPEVIGSLRPGIPAAVVRRFMTTPDPDLVVEGATLSPRDWLLAGGEAAFVTDLATELGDFA